MREQNKNPNFKINKNMKINRDNLSKNYNLIKKIIRI